MREQIKNLSSQLKSNQIHSNTRLIIVMGVSGCGKSTIARVIADRFQCEFLDADDFHTEKSKDLMQQGIALTDEIRLPWVRRIQEHINSLFIEEKCVVIAFSGLKKIHRDLLRDTTTNTLLLHLLVEKSKIQMRLNKRENHFMSSKLVESQFQSLEDPSNEMDVVTIEANQDIAQVVECSIQAIEAGFA